MKTKNFLYIFLCINILALGACGVKPKHVEAPSGEKNDTFPHTYPDISTDRAPEYKN